MRINSFEELVSIANEKENDLDKLKLLQQYFIENVEFNYAEEIAQTETFHPELLSVDFKKEFSSLEEKIEEISNFEERFGKNFHFSKNTREKLLSYLGEKIEPYRKKHTFNGSEYYINYSGYNGSILDCIKRFPIGPEYKNGLIIYGVCETFSEFAKNYCDNVGINCSIYGTEDNHVFLVAEISGELKIFDFARMIGVRDGYINPNNQQINDWFNMTFEKMFEYKPNRVINKIDYTKLAVPITKENFRDFINKNNRKRKNI